MLAWWDVVWVETGNECVEAQLKVESQLRGIGEDCVLMCIA